MTQFLVQETSGSTTGTSLTLTLGTAATIGNGIILAISGFRGSSISGITLGGTGSLFKDVSATSNDDFNAQIWYCSPVSVSSTSIVITAGAGGIIAYAYEVAGYLPGPNPGTGTSALTPDQNEWSDNTGTSWSSGATGTTLPVTEFVVGIGATVGTSSTTITGPASGGWTNETAINGVNAGSYYYGSVSGYQEQGWTGATYDYSGTVNSSTGWAAVTATFMLMTTYENWGGYVFNEHSSYTGISATFTVPSLSGETGSFGSVWVGLGNVYQVGIDLDYDTSETGNVFAGCWSEWVPGPYEQWDTTAYPVKAGDSLTVSMELTATDWLMTISNATQDWSYTEVKSVLAVNIGQLENAPSGPAFWPYPCATAEIIIEDEGDEADPAQGNPDYGSVEFTSITTTPAIVDAPQPLGTVNTDIDQYPGQFTSGSFTMHWNAYT